jgi:hypothetical protein
MSLAEEMAALWGADGLQKAPWVALEPLKVPPASKKFLADVGLPREELLCISFDLEVNWLPTLREEAARKHFPPPSNADHYRMIGRGGHAPNLYLDERAGGAVVEIDAERPGSPRFVNSSVEALASFLLAFRKSFVREEMSDEENARYVARMKSDLRLVDGRAFSDPQNWWPLVVEQMEDGLL